MNNLLTYEQMFESTDSGGVMKILNRIKMVDSSKMIKLISKHGNLIEKLVKKYVVDGVIMVDKIESDVKNLQFGVSENLENENVILRLLYKFFYSWPKAVVEVIWEYIYDLVIYPFKKGRIISSMIGSIGILIVAGIVCLFSIWILSVGDVMVNGIERGRVEKVEFIPAHDEMRVQTIYNGGQRSDWYYTEHVPDGWQVYVSDGERVETWITHSKELGNTTEVGDSLTNGIGWRWIGTVKK